MGNTNATGYTPPAVPSFPVTASVRPYSACAPARSLSRPRQDNFLEFPATAYLRLQQHYFSLSGVRCILSPSLEGRGTGGLQGFNHSLTITRSRDTLTLRDVDSSFGRALVVIPLVLRGDGRSSSAFLTLAPADTPSIDHFYPSDFFCAPDIVLMYRLTTSCLIEPPCPNSSHWYSGSHPYFFPVSPSFVCICAGPS